MAAIAVGPVGRGKCELESGDSCLALQNFLACPSPLLTCKCKCKCTLASCKVPGPTRRLLKREARTAGQPAAVEAGGFETPQVAAAGAGQGRAGARGSATPVTGERPQFRRSRAYRLPTRLMKQTSGAEKWYALCEHLSARPPLSPPTFVSSHPAFGPASTPPFPLQLTVRLRRDTLLDTVMADRPGTPAASVVAAGMKRGRDDDDGGAEMEDVDGMVRAEKVCYQRARDHRRQSILTETSESETGVVGELRHTPARLGHAHADGVHVELHPPGAQIRQ